jgi:hypothetical protein
MARSMTCCVSVMDISICSLYVLILSVDCQAGGCRPIPWALCHASDRTLEGKEVVLIRPRLRGIRR